MSSTATRDRVSLHFTGTRHFTNTIHKAAVIAPYATRWMRRTGRGANAFHPERGEADVEDVWAEILATCPDYDDASDVTWLAVHTIVCARDGVAGTSSRSKGAIA